MTDILETESVVICSCREVEGESKLPAAVLCDTFAVRI